MPPVFHFTVSRGFRAIPRFTKVALFTSGLLGGSLYLSRSHLRSHDPSSSGVQHVPLSTLLRSYVVYSICSFPSVVEASPTMLSILLATPGIRSIARAIVRSTFFAQFVGGESAQDTLPILTELRRRNIGVLLAYSVEVDQEQAQSRTEELIVNPTDQSYKRNVEETLRCINVAADFEDRIGSESGRKTWVAIKVTALLPSAKSLISLSNHLRQIRPEISPSVPFPGYPHHSDLDFIESDAPSPTFLSNDDVVALKSLYHDLTRIAELGKRRGVQLIVDAEYSWYQPAIDAFTQSLMRRFNSLRDIEGHPDSLKGDTSVQPLIYATYQAYLKRTPEQLRRSLSDAEHAGYSLGVKLVRGAYHHFEINAAPSPDLAPVWSNKPETDACYDACAAILVSALREDIDNHDEPPHLGVLFGTHNSNSCAKILDALVKEGLAHARTADGTLELSAKATERCTIGQLFGMSGTLTEKLVLQVNAPCPFVVEYVPYGPLEAVMPYLSRRAIENKSILSGDDGATAERKRIGYEIRKRLLGSWIHTASTI